MAALVIGRTYCFASLSVQLARAAARKASSKAAAWSSYTDINEQICQPALHGHVDLLSSASSRTCHSARAAAGPTASAGVRLPPSAAGSRRWPRWRCALRCRQPRPRPSTSLTRSIVPSTRWAGFLQASCPPCCSVSCDRHALGRQPGWQLVPAASFARFALRPLPICRQVNAARVADYIVSQQVQQEGQHVQHGRSAGPPAGAQFLVVSHKPQVGWRHPLLAPCHLVLPCNCLAEHLLHASSWRCLPANETCGPLPALMTSSPSSATPTAAANAGLRAGRLPGGRDLPQSGI